MKKSLRVIIAVVVLIAGARAVFSPPSVSAQQGGTACYFYDANGRLHSVVWSTGEVAIYQYDASGNLLGISRTPTPSSISGFSPTSGPVGTFVTITGTGFGATSKDNTVTFNGLPSEIVSASTTQILTKVPDGATTGPLAVIMETSAAVSGTPFTVTLPSTGPMITGFTPAIGLAGAPVTISGTNFDPIPINDQLKFNVSTAIVSSASATTLATTVPNGATSGHISLTTPSGSTVSNGDFFVPPSGKTPADVEFTGRMAVGDTRTVPINTNGKIGLMLFDGTAGQKVSLLVGNSTLNGTISLNSTAGAAMASIFSSSGSFVDAKTLPVSGTYTILITKLSGTAGSVTLKLTDVTNDAMAILVPGGPPATVTIVSGQNATLTFNGSAGQRVSVFVSTPLPINSTVTLLDPSSQVVGTDKNINSFVGATLFIDVRQLTTTGTYKIFIDPTGPMTGNITCAVYDVPPDVTGTIAANGQPVTISTTTPGQNASLVFNGVAGQRVVFASTFVGFGVAVTILKPDLTVLKSSLGAFFNETFLDVMTLPVTGAYTILLDPFREGAGAMNCTLYDVPADVTGTINPDGVPVNITTTVPGQVAVLTFTATVSQRFSLLVSFSSSVPTPGFGISLRDQGGTFSTQTSASGEIFIDKFPAQGRNTTYTLTLDPPQTLTGTFTATLYEMPPDISNTIAIGGQPVTVTTTVPGQNAKLTFDGVAGQTISLRGIGANGYLADVRIFRPGGNFLNSAGLGDPAQELFIDATILPDTGLYSISIDPRKASIGSKIFTLYSAPAVAGSLEVGGSPVTVNLNSPGQNASLTFTTTGQIVTIRANSQILGCVTVELHGPDGSSWTGVFWCDGSGSFDLETLNLPAGTYTVFVNPDGASTGSVTISATSP